MTYYWPMPEANNSDWHDSSFEELFNSEICSDLVELMGIELSPDNLKFLRRGLSDAYDAYHRAKIDQKEHSSEKAENQALEKVARHAASLYEAMSELYCLSHAEQKLASQISSFPLQKTADGIDLKSLLRKVGGFPLHNIREFLIDLQACSENAINKKPKREAGWEDWDEIWKLDAGESYWEDGIEKWKATSTKHNLPRDYPLQCFAKWVTAAEPALGWSHGAFIDSFEANRQSVQQAAIDGNPVAEAILSLVADLGKWSGTATELLFKLKSSYPMLTDDPQSFPRQPNRLSSELRRIQPLLRARNVELSVLRKGKTGARLIQLRCA